MGHGKTVSPDIVAEGLGAVEARFGALERYRQGPSFWVSHPERGRPILETLKAAEVRTIGRSAGGREITALAYGVKEPLDASCDNLSSCMEAVTPADNGRARDRDRLYPPAFFGATRRRRTVLVLQGAIHGGELTGTVAGFNLCRVIETGRDLRDKPWPRLSQLAREARIVFIPWLNPDGTARHPIHTCMELPDGLDRVLNEGMYRHGATYPYPLCKRTFPIPVGEAIHLGSYYNDHGINLQYDVFREALQPETLAWMRCYRDERPDAVLNFHCDNGSMIHAPSAVPEALRAVALRLGGAVMQRLTGEGYRTLPTSWEGASEPVPAMTQNAAIWHVSGALPLLCELPDGMGVPMTPDELLDVGLIAIEETLDFARTHGVRAYENLTKRREAESEKERKT